MSIELWRQALELFPGGVNSPVRAAVKPYPFYVIKGEGPYIYTIDKAKLIDYVLGYGPLILGHSHPEVREKIISQVVNGWLFGTPTEFEVKLAQKIVTHVPSAQKVRFVNSGTEATMLAIRLARGFTNREKILKFDGNYHGAHDYVLVDAGSAASEYGVPNSLGVPGEVAKLTLVCQYNDLECVEKVLESESIAAVIVEPVMGNMGVILPQKDFLKGLRELTKTYNSLLIFDEVITGFRLGLSGAQGYFGVIPDLTTLGKIIGGGLPIGAVAGHKKIMDYLTPAGKVFNAGTFNANPLSMIAGIATIEVLERGKAYEVAREAAKSIVEELELIVKGPYTMNTIESMFQIFFDVKNVNNTNDARKANREKYAKFHEGLLRNGIFIPPSQFETIFTSGVHTSDVVNETIEKMKKVLSDLEA